MDWTGYCFHERRNFSIGVDDELIPFQIIDKALPAEDCSSASATTTTSAVRHEWASWIQLGLPGGGSLWTHEEHHLDALLSQDVVSSGYDPDGGLSPQYPADSPTSFGGPLNLYGSLPPVVYGPGGKDSVNVSSTESSSPVMRLRIPGEGEFYFDLNSSRPVQCEEATTDAEPDPKDYMMRPVDESSSPERSPVSNPTHCDASSRGVGSELPDVDALQPLSLEATLDDLTQPVVSEASPPDGVLAVPLMKHQRIALSWMLHQETCSGTSCAGGILADDQGLGKTLSTIALIVSEMPQQRPTSIEEVDDDLAGSDDKLGRHGSNLTCRKRSRTTKTSSTPDTASVLVPSLLMSGSSRPAGGTLVVCPTSVLRQWADELQDKVTSNANISFLVYHGPNRTGDPKELARYDVVLTTYHIVGMEVPKELLADGEDNTNDDDDEDWLGHGHDSVPGRPDACSIFASNNKRRKQNPRCCVNTDSGRVTEQAAARWPLAMVLWFRVVLDEAQMIKNHKTLAARACSRLRAKRRWCLSGTPIQNSINDLYSYFRFLRYKPYSEIPSFRYDVKFLVERNPVLGYRKLQAVLKGVLLRRTKETLIDGQPIVNIPPKSLEVKALDFSAEERAFYNDLESASRERFKEYNDTGTVKQNLVNILQLLLRLRQACNHPALIRPAGSDSSTSASTVPLLAEDAKRLGKDKCLDLLQAAFQALCAVCSDPPEDAVVSICGHVFCNQCIWDRLATDDAEEKSCPKPGCKRKLSASTVFTKASMQSCIGDVKPAPATSFAGESSTTVNGISEQKGGGVFHAGSSKIKAAMEMLLSLPKLDHSSSGHEGGIPAASHATDKALVFSQWTKMLDLLETELRTSNIRYNRLDGTMSIADRDRAVKRFNSQPEVTVMLISLKAASLGLNMVAANHVLLLDPWWNPTTEDQAIDRVHRIGQTRPVKVTRFTVKETVEDRIMNLHEKKRRMVDYAFGEVRKGSRQSQLTVEDLNYLFKV